ncbi:molecular chaperone [Buttiauxella sp. A111]|uniref:fimbrial biogenesis chaperone n=1 Tax=Buttiauxella sp. A111 TaxID=2563088 RepID=UPI0010D21321|nr:molecular chaperone [Buttiauxella sp. A111]GDX05080.1 pili assembly chaperone [Buttiauxella sp. A111]
MKKRLASLLLLISLQASAGIQVGETRVIYNGNQKSAALSIHNDTDETWMVQTWLDNGDASKTPANLPMQVIPPILKLAGNKDAILRFIYSGNGLPGDRESVYWINVQEIPPSAKQENVLQIAVRTRVKLFYRPTTVKTTLLKEAEALTWRKQGNDLVVTNNGPLHVTFGVLTLKGSGGKTWKTEADMVKPMASLRIALPAGASAANNLSFTFINDYGGHTEIKDTRIQ